MSDDVLFAAFSAIYGVFWYSVGFRVGRGKRRKLFGDILSVTPQPDGSVVTICVKEPKR